MAQDTEIVLWLAKKAMRADVGFVFVLIFSGGTMFEQFWKVYPRKVGKGGALKAWNKIKPDADLAQQIIKAVEAQKSYRARVERANALLPRWKQTFLPNIKHPTTWLNQGCWEDEVPESLEEKTEQKKRNNVCAGCSGEFQYLYTVNGKHFCLKCYDKNVHPEYAAH